MQKVRRGQSVQKVKRGQSVQKIKRGQRVQKVNIFVMVTCIICDQSLSNGFPTVKLQQKNPSRTVCTYTM